MTVDTERTPPLVDELREFLTKMGWVIRHESEWARSHGTFGEDITHAAIPMIAGWVYAQIMRANYGDDPDNWKHERIGASQATGMEEEVGDDE